MNLRETTINGAMQAFDQVSGDILRALRRVAVDQALRAEGMPRLTADEALEVDAAADRGQLPYCDCATGCQRCGS